jgi:Flp pilus assembly protein TadB
MPPQAPERAQGDAPLAGKKASGRVNLLEWVGLIVLCGIFSIVALVMGWLCWDKASRRKAERERKTREARERELNEKWLGRVTWEEHVDAEVERIIHESQTESA